MVKNSRYEKKRNSRYEYSKHGYTRKKEKTIVREVYGVINNHIEKKYG